MRATALLKEPSACTEHERHAFARLVREGFAWAEDLEARILDARCLAFCYAPDDTLTGVAALKVPSDARRAHIFGQANAPVSHRDYLLDLGWIFVPPAHRRNGIGKHLCQQLMARVPTSSVFSTTATTNAPMQKILPALGFVRVGKPYQRRDEHLALHLRSSSKAPFEMLP